MIPLKDINRSSTTPHVNYLILIANIVIFTVYWLASVNIFWNVEFASEIDQRFVMVPEVVLHGQQLYTLFTSMFMHAGWLHLLGNMLFLYVFGDNVEDAFGHISYAVFYIISGLGAAFAYIESILLFPGLGDLTAGLVGASGAISGVLGAYAILYPKARIVALVFYVILPVPAVLFLGLWFVMQLFLGVFDLSGGIAYTAHIGGFLVGVILALTFGMRRKKAREARLRL